MKKVKKLLIPVAVVMMMASCTVPENSQVANNDVTKANIVNINKRSDSYAYNALSSVRLMGLDGVESDDSVSFDSTSVDSTSVDVPSTDVSVDVSSTDDISIDVDTPSSDVSVDTDEPTNDDVTIDENADLELVNRYLDIYENLVNGEGVLVSDIMTSDNEAYTSLIVITTRSIDGVVSTYKLYYNEVVVEEDSVEEVMPEEDTSTSEDVLTSEDVPSSDKVSEDNLESDDTLVTEDAPLLKHGHGHHERDYDKDDMGATLIEGLMVTDSQTVEVKGFSKIDENDTETVLMACLEDGTKIKVKQHSSEDDVSFSYKMSNKKQVIEQSKLCIEKDENHTELKLESYKDGVYEKYSFEEETLENQRVIKIKYHTPEERGVIHIFITVDENGQEVMNYELSNGHNYHHDHNGWHHGHHGHGHHGNGHNFKDDESWDGDYWSKEECEYDHREWEDHDDFDWDSSFENDNIQQEDIDIDEDVTVEDNRPHHYWDHHHDDKPGHGGHRK